MPIDKPYQDIPGTTIFDADQARKGYWLNQFCMSLMKAENRERFKADERAYLADWPMTPAQKDAVLARDLNQCIRLGGNIYFLAKIGATDGRSYQQMAAGMTGMTESDYRDMMLAGGRRPDGTPRRAAVASGLAADASTATQGDTRQDTRQDGKHDTTQHTTQQTTQHTAQDTKGSAR